MNCTLLAATAVAALIAGPALAQNTNSVGLPASGKRAPDTAQVLGRPLPVNDPTAPAQKPAFAGQMRAPAVVTRTPIDVQVKTRGLDHPWGMAFIGDGKVLVTEKPGTMRIIDMASGMPVAGVSEVPRVVYGGDAGLLDVVADPNFAQNRTIYFTYVEPRGEKDSGVIVAKARLDPPKGGNQAPMYKLAEVTTLLRVDPSLPQQAHYGSRLVFDRDGYLYVSLAERFFSPTRDEAQSLYTWLGKVLRVDTSGKPAPGNPYAANQEAENHTRAEIWSYGHRNPQGLAINPVDGSLWDAEHGPDGGDEINRIERGANYGWPLVAYGTNYDHSAIQGGRTQMPNTIQPRYVWQAAVAPGGITFYSGNLIPEWKNNLFVAALAGQHLARLVIDVDAEDALMPSLLTLSDVMGTGHHAAVTARVARGSTVAVVGDGAVGLCGVIAAKRLGAERIIIMGRHADRIALAREFGATDVVSERDDAAVQRIMELTGGFGAHSVLECVGTEQSIATSMAIARPGGAVGRVGVPHYQVVLTADQMFFKNISVAGPPAPSHAYIAELLPDIMEGRIDRARCSIAR